MNNFLESNLNKIGTKKLLLINRIFLTIIGIFFFLIWLVFITNNFYPREENNVADKLMSLPVSASIWPVTFIALFIFIMPIWAINSFWLLVTILVFSLIISLFSFVFLAFININVAWILWLLINIVTYAAIVFAIISVFYLYKPGK